MTSSAQVPCPASSTKNFSGTLNEQVQILRAYEEDIVKYASGLDKAKIKNIYTQSLIPLEVKASDNATASLRNLVGKEKYPDIRYGIKLCDRNVGFNGSFYTFPYFCAFMLRRYLMERGGS